MSKGKHLKEKDKSKNRPERKKKWDIISVSVTAAFFAAVTAALIFFERPDQSLTERRELAKFPEFDSEALFSGKFTEGVSEWFNDTVPWRDGFKDISANISKHMGISLGGVTVYGGPSAVVTTPAAESPPAENTSETTVGSDAPDSTAEASVTETAEITEAAETAETAAEAPYDPRNEIAPGVQTNGQIVCLQNGHYRGISLYGGGFNRDSFVKYVNAFAEDLGEGISTYVMIAPTSGEYYTPKNFEEYNASQSDDIFYIAEHLGDKVTSVDCVNPLREHITEEIYTRTDHHWQPLGAYYAAKEFAEAAGVEFPELDTFEKREVEGYVGTMYGFTQNADLLNDPETFTYYIPANDFGCYYYDTAYNYDNKYPFFLQMPVSSSYSIFMGGDEKIVRIETDVKNGRRLAVFKDSYGNAEIPFYMGGFEEIYVCDIRYFDLNAVDFLTDPEKGITDVLFTMCTFSAAGVNCDYIEEIRTR
ncbi:MAG: DHHW family protein [Bacteroides sp.]|nr:DHHW family protein [Bacteroides sp.]